VAERPWRTRQAELPPDQARIPLKTIHLNRAPVISPISALRDVDLQRIDLDPGQCEHHRQLLLRQPDGLADKIRAVFSQPPEPLPKDPDQALYDGLLKAADQRLLPQLRAAEPQRFRELSANLRDPRLVELAFRYQARNFPATLDAEQQARWGEHRRSRLLTATDDQTPLDRYRTLVDELKLETTDPDQRRILQQLAQWGENLAANL